MYRHGLISQSIYFSGSDIVRGATFATCEEAKKLPHSF